MRDISGRLGGAEPPVSRLCVGGDWTDAAGGARFAVHDPATGELLAHVADGGAEETRRAIEAAAAAFPAWSRTTPAERAAVLDRARALLLERAEPMARLIAREEGKPLAESRGEIRYAAEFLRFFAAEAQRSVGEVIAPHMPGKRLLTVRQPVGVAGLITIWNFPVAGVTRPAGAALAAGCTAVLKPPEQTPLSAIAVVQILEEAGLPAGVLNLVTSNRPELVGRELLDHPLVRKISFTGSVEIGRRVLRGAVDDLKRVSLELGGHAPLIVLDDADVEAAVAAAIQSKFRNNGQTCITVNRILVHDSIAADFTARFVEQVRELTVGNPLDERVHVGPLIDDAAIAKVEAHVADAVDLGAEVLVGGTRLDTGEHARGHFFQPTVLGGADDRMLIMREETFGPVAPISTFNDDDDVLERANALPLGLATFFYTRDLSRAVRFAERLDYGIVGVNDALPGAPHVPFGGVKHSGIGKEGGRMGLDEFLDTKLISINVGS